MSTEAGDGPARRRAAVLALVFGAAVIGIAPILPRLAETGPAAAAFWRLAFATPLLLLLAWRSDGGPGRPRPLALMAGLFFAADMAFWHYGLSYTSVANATVLTNLTPLVVTAAAWILLKERPAALFLVALALAVAGAVVIATAAGSGGRGTNPPLGDALSAFTALWYGGYFLCVREARRAQGAARVMLWAGLAGAPALALTAVLLGEDLWPDTAAGWAACAGLGLVHVAGQGSIAWALGRLPTALASVTVLVQPVVAAMLGWLIFSEAVGPVQGLGAAVLLGGVVLAQVSSLRTYRKTAAGEDRAAAVR